MENVLFVNKVHFWQKDTACYVLIETFMIIKRKNVSVRRVLFLLLKGNALIDAVKISILIRQKRLVYVMKGSEGWKIVVFFVMLTKK